jgi:uncharacterized protein
MDYFLFILAGAFAGTMAGLLGIGGGMIVVPVLSFIFSAHMHISPQNVMHVASGSSLCAMIFTSQSSVFAHLRHGNVKWRLFLKMAGFIATGAAFGAVIADILSTQVIKKTFGFFLFVVAIEMIIFSRKPKIKKIKPPVWVTQMVGLVVGSISGLLGIGGGTLLVPYLSKLKIQTRQIAALSSLCSLISAIVATIAVMLTGLNDNYNVPWSTGYVYWPAVLMVSVPSIVFAQIAGRWSYKIKPRYLKMFFITLLLITSIFMLL